MPVKTLLQIYEKYRDTAAIVQRKKIDRVFTALSTPGMPLPAAEKT